jgi:putative NADH-flavin reductase
MQITILGATRPIGTHAAKKALDNGHVVVLLVRRGPNSLPDSVRKHEKAGTHLKIITGDVRNEEELKEATEGSDAVLNFLGGGKDRNTTIVGDTTKVWALVYGSDC